MTTSESLAFTTAAADAQADPGFGVYIHWPFCLAKCPYCDFNSHVRAEPVDEERFVAAFKTEITHRAALTPGREARSIFFGGGTPSLMKPQTVQALIDAVAAAWPLAADAEITLEANPTSVEAGRFRGYRAAGVNRISIGVQALDDADLKALGRRHSVAEAIEAVKTAMAIFPRSSFDLIYARPGQSEAAWRAELTQAMALAGEHLSIYQLTIEPDTIFERLWKAGKLKTPDEELGRALFDATQEIAEAHGMPAYEVSNHARPGAECRHNLVYWRYGEYVGVGPGAHGRILGPDGRRAQATEKHPEMWLTQVESEGHGLIDNTPLSAEEQGDEFLLMGLRLREGVDSARFAALSGRTLRRRQIDDLVAEGFIEETPDGRIRVTSSGAPLLDSVVADLAA
jgi:putative oxygen-independent coproporphyrinogen III oxidase